MATILRSINNLFGRLLKIKNRAVAKFSNLNQQISAGHQFLQQRQFGEAQEVFLKIAEAFPHQVQGYEGMAAVALQTWDWERAADWLGRSIRVTKAKSSYRKKAELLINHGQFAEGFDLIHDLMKIHGADEDAQLFKAAQLFKPRRYEEAVDLLKTLPEKQATLVLLARALIGAKRYDDANLVIGKLGMDLSPGNDKDEKILKLLASWQKRHLAGATYEQPKIFGIGLSRTATTSLTSALEILGFSAIHFINPITNQVIDSEDFLYFDAFTDSPVSFRFEELYGLFPNARFIYTERELPDWVRSSSNLYRPRRVHTTLELRDWLDRTDGGRFDKLYHNFDPVYQQAYKSLYADFPDWESAYLAFDQRVNRFFANKPDGKWLKINLCKEPGWENLCHFLNVPAPTCPFPYSNTVVTRNKTKSASNQ